MKKGMSNTLATVLVALVVILVLGGIVWAAVSKKTNETNYAEYDVNSIIAANDDNGNIGDHVKGNPDAPVVIFEYADYQCSACATINPRVNKIVEEYGDKLAVVYRNFLLSYHQNGTAAASAAEAAAIQGFWKEYANKLFTNQSVWANASGDSRTDIFLDLFRSVTEGTGDEAKFVADMKSEEVKKKISFDVGISKNLDIPGTPAFFIDGERIDFSDAKTVDGYLDVFREKINAKLNLAE